MSEKPTSQALAAIVVAHRTLGGFKTEAKSAMAELVFRRKQEGDDFDYEKYIEEKIAALPKQEIPGQALNMLSFLGATQQDQKSR